MLLPVVFLKCMYVSMYIFLSVVDVQCYIIFGVQLSDLTSLCIMYATLTTSVTTICPITLLLQCH